MTDLPFRPTHRHYKGGLYQKIADALHSETEEPLVIYRSADGRWWARPKAMFDEPDRFTPIEDA